MQQTEIHNQTPQTVSRPPTIIDHLTIIIRHRRMIALTTVSITVTAALISLFMPNVYTANAKILPPQQQAGLLSAAMMQGALAAIGGDILGESKTAKLYVEMLKTESLRDPIIDRFKLIEVYKKKFREDVYKAMNKTVSVVAGKEGIITISVDDQNPKRAADMANGIVEELKKLTMRMSMTGAANSKTFLEERIAKNRNELVQAENELKEFQSKYKTIDATQQATLSASATSQLAAQLTSQEIQLSVLRRTYADSSQPVKALKQAISVLREKIGQQQSGGGSVALPGFEQIPERGQEYIHLMRRYKTAEVVSEMLAKQYEVAKLNAENDVSSIQVIQKALVPERKSKPSRSSIVIASAFAAMFFSIILVFSREKFNSLDGDSKDRWRSLMNRQKQLGKPQGELV